MKCFYSILFVFALCILKSQTFEWAQKDFPMRMSEGKKICVDKSHNAYVAGIYGHHAFSDDPAGVVIYKYSSAGQKIWTVFISGAKNPRICVDSDEVLLSAQDSTGYFVNRYTFSGSFVSHQVIFAASTGTVKAEISGIGADASDNFYLTGVFKETVVIGNYTLTTNPPPLARKLYLLKMDQQGNCLWAKNSTKGEPFPRVFLSVNDQGDCFIAGGCPYELEFDNQSIIPPYLTTAAFFMITDQNGSLKLLKQISTGKWGSVDVLAVSHDEDGNILVSGEFAGGNISYGGDTTSYKSGIHGFLLKAERNGIDGWINHFPGYSSYVSGLSSANNNIFIAGTQSDSCIIAPGFTLKNNKGYEGFVAKFDQNGQIQWATQLGLVNTKSAIRAESFDAAVDRDEHVFMTGAFVGAVYFGGFAHATDTCAMFTAMIDGFNDVGIKDLSDAKINLYPNPASNDLQLKTNGRRIDNVTLTDLNGLVLKQWSGFFENVPLQVSDLPRGLYLVTINCGQENVVKKVALQ